MNNIHDNERYGKISDKLKAVRKILNADIIERDDNPED